jgi:hypothetical protein
MKKIISSLFVSATLAVSLHAQTSCEKKSPSTEFVKEARIVYEKPEYASYTNSIIKKFLCKKGKSYYDQDEGGIVGWVKVEGARNVRDIGGWNNLATGKVYRGSELNTVKNHGLNLTEKGRQVMREKMKIKTDLDFRAVNKDERGEFVNVSPLGADIKLLDHPISNYTSMFKQTNQYAKVMRVFADSNNYPIYMHCWGGADRTGTVAFILQGLCGVSETDLAIDFELTSFAIFGSRQRRNRGGFKYAEIIQKIKTYEGCTLADKFRSYAKITLGLTDKEIDAIRKNLMNQ